METAIMIVIAMLISYWYGTRVGWNRRSAKYWQDEMEWEREVKEAEKNR